MKDPRVKGFRTALDQVVESLDALVRVSRWADATEAPPEPLRAAVSKLPERLGAANKLASGTYTGSPPDMAQVNAMQAKTRRLDAAYSEYQKRLASQPEQARDAAAALDADLAEATSAAGF